LEARNFSVVDGTRQVPIASFGRQDQPVTVGLIFDCSRSMADKFKIARQAPRELFRQLNAADESFLVTISNRAELRQPMTSDFEQLQNLLVFTPAQGKTPLIDGMCMGLQQMRKSHNLAKALVVVSDGGDNNSRYTQSELQRLAMESDTEMFAAGLYENAQSPEEDAGPELMDSLCARTGGANFAVKDEQGLRDAMTKIGVSLHNQYVLGFYPPDGAASGKYRKIKVGLRLPSRLPALQIHARAGYYAPTEN
jgi:Ca-activated chloride channel family protein